MTTNTLALLLFGLALFTVALFAQWRYDRARLKRLHREIEQLRNDFVLMPHDTIQVWHVARKIDQITERYEF